MKHLILLSAFCFVLSITYAQQAENFWRPPFWGGGNDPKYCLLFIGDGFGVSAKTAARMAMGQGTEGKRFPDQNGFKVLAFDKLRFNTMVTTHSANSWITDSGPGASVYASGEKGKIDNEAISYNVASGQSVATILEEAKKEGYAVGLVTTTRLTHATPAAFASHTWFRDLEDYIAAQYLSATQGQYMEIFNSPVSLIRPYNPERDWELPSPKKGVEVDVLLGGGLRHFYPAGSSDTVRDNNQQPIMNNGSVVKMSGRRTDNVNLVNVAKDRGYTYLNSRDALLNLDISQFTAKNNKKLLGLFNASHMAFEQDRQAVNNWEPSLPEMVEMAIKVLKAKGGKKGFFLMVEGGRIDHLEHANTGGISVVAGSPANQYTVDSDKPAYTGDGEAIYAATPSSTRQNGVFGSDYLIKEVLAFNYAVDQGRQLLKSSDKVLLFSTSDHECGGTAIVGLHDQANEQKNGTYIRTYALGPRQNGNPASSGGPATVNTVLTPNNLQRGDVDFGATSASGWYPNYSTYTFQGRPERWPRVDVNGRRIVVAYASNPLTNGNGTNAGGTPGNHTPMDIWVGADDNTPYGRYASRITSKGLLDNTSLTEIMADFLHLNFPFGERHSYYSNNSLLDSVETKPAFAFKSYPAPANGTVRLDFTLPQQSTYFISIFSASGTMVKTLSGTASSLNQSIPMDVSSWSNGLYAAKLTVKHGSQISTSEQKILVQK